MDYGIDLIKIVFNKDDLTTLIYTSKFIQHFNFGIEELNFKQIIKDV